jgi:hypothetical protein
MTEPTRAAPDPPAGPPLTLPALVARVREEATRAEALSRAMCREPPKARAAYLAMERAVSEAAAFVLDSALPADALKLCGRAERLEAACRLTLEVIARHQSVFRHQDPAFSRLAHDLRAVLAGAGPAETPAEAAAFDRACDFPPPDPEAVDRAIREHRERHPYRGAGGPAEGDAGGGGT